MYCRLRNNNRLIYYLQYIKANCNYYYKIVTYNRFLTLFFKWLYYNFIIAITDLKMLHKIHIQFYSIVAVVVEDDSYSSNNPLYKTFVQGINSKKIKSSQTVLSENSCNNVFNVL